jgi:hypothetical protein
MSFRVLALDAPSICMVEENEFMVLDAMIAMRFDDGWEFVCSNIHASMRSVSCLAGGADNELES